MAGYSGTPLVKKLGIKEGLRLAFINAPENFEDELCALPPGIAVDRQGRRGADFIILFVKTEGDLEKRLPKLAARLSPSGMFWVAWPKKASGVPTDLSFNVVQNLGLEAGLVDIKICAIDETWSGLKFVYRLKDREDR
jgi:hypothetical protein